MRSRAARLARRSRGIDTYITPDGPSLLSSSCVGCGSCVDTCPTGALEDATVESLDPPLNWTPTICPYCGVGCGVSAGTRSGRLVSIKPLQSSPVSRGHLCVKGRYAFEYVHAGDRVTDPMIRDCDGWRRVAWDEALDFAAARLRDVIGRRGPDAIGVLASARQTNEENYLMQKFARVVVGTNNVDCCARVCHAPSSTALKQALVPACRPTRSTTSNTPRRSDLRREPDREPSSHRRADPPGG
jgi:formate dehydrogenase major subunit